ncbi:MAG: TraV family lipoprotein [Gammaproteobacteria bacterium]
MRILITLMMSCLLCGCISMLGVGEQEFSCKGFPEGSRCVAARDLLEATDHVDRVGPTGDKTGADAVADDSYAGVYQTLPAGYSPATPAVIPQIEEPLPIRTPSSVMRILIMPWETEGGDLNAGGLVYTEVQGRRWSLGEPAISSPPRFFPLQRNERVTQTPGRGSPNSDYDGDPGARDRAVQQATEMGRGILTQTGTKPKRNPE